MRNQSYPSRRRGYLISISWIQTAVNKTTLNTTLIKLILIINYTIRQNNIIRIRITKLYNKVLKYR